MLKDFITRFVKHNQELPLDARLTNQVILILSAVAFLCGFINLIITLPWWFPVLFYSVGTISTLSVLINYYKPYLVYKKISFLILIYALAILGWPYNSGINSVPVIFFFATLIYSIGVFNSNFFLLFLLNFSVFTTLVIIGYSYPGFIKFHYVNERDHVIDVLCTYFLLGFSIVFLLRTIINSYKKAKTSFDEKTKAFIISESKFRTSLNISPIPLVINYDGQHITFINNAFIKTFGYTLEDIPTLSDWWPKAYPDGAYRERVINDWNKEFERSEKTGTRFNDLEVTIRCKDGSEKIVMVSATRFGDPFEGDYLVTLYDITERKKVEMALKKREHEFTTLVENSPDMIVRFDSNYRYLYFNKTVEKQFGIYLNDYFGKTEFEINGVNEGSELIINSLKKAKDSKKEIEVERSLNTPEGILFFQTRIVPEFNENNEIISFLAVTRNITQSKRAEQELKDSNQLLSLFIQHSPIHAYIKEVRPNESRVLFASDIFTNMIGINGSDMLGKTMEELFPKDFAKKITDDDWYVVKSNDVITINEEFNGRHYTTIKFPISLGNRNLLAGYTIEITERLKSEQIINQQNIELKKLNADKDLFMSILAHDLKVPFNSLLGFSNLLLENFEKYNIDKLKFYISSINQTSYRTYNLLEDLLLWSKAQSGKLKPQPKYLSLSAICSEIIEILKIHTEVKNITLRYFESEYITVFADSDMLKTIIRNLVSNAIKFTDNGGKINVYAVIEQEDVVVTVSDNGIGISKENQQQLWDFSHISTSGTANEKGSGLGLIVCKEFVEQLGGRIWVESERGKGSEFKFTMPLSPKQ